MPLVSVIMPVYNAENHLKEAIDSILSQTFIDFEFLIFNDGSKDKSADLIRSYNDQRILFFDQDYNSGYVKHLNKGIELAKGKYIARMDADDISDVSRFEKQIAVLESNSEIGLCSCWYDVIGTNKEFKYKEHHKDICSQMMVSNPICHPGVMIRKQILMDFNLKYDEQYVPAEDYMLWTKISKFTKLYNIQEFLLHYRMHEGQISSYKREIQNFNIKKCQFNIIIEQCSLKESDKEILFDIFFTKNKTITTGELIQTAKIFYKSIKINNSIKVFEKATLQKFCNEKFMELNWQIKEYYPSGILLVLLPFFSLYPFKKKITYLINCLLYRKAGVSFFWGKIFDLMSLFKIEKHILNGKEQFKTFKLIKKIKHGNDLKIGSYTDIEIEKETEIVFGNKVIFGKNCRIQVENGKLILGNKVYLNDYTSIFIKGGKDMSEITLGENIEFRKYCHLLAFPGAKLFIGNNVFFNNHCSINCLHKIEIGENTIFGEGVKIYDHNHLFKTHSGIDVKKDEFSLSPIKIGKNCWIASNVTILKGVEIGDNVIIGANCLIYKSISSNSIVKMNGELLIESR